METTIGVVGIGRMGLPVCARLADAGMNVVAHDQRPDPREAVSGMGATWAPDAGGVAAAVDAFITILPGTSELRTVMDMAIPELRPGTTWIDMTSSTLATAREIGARARARGIECLDAPVGGGPAAAAAGELQLFVGGREAIVERHRRLLEVLGAVEHVGDHGAGYVTKLLVNLLWFGQAVATGEALLLARRAGLDLEVLRETLERSSASSEFLRGDLDALLDGDYLESFGLDRCVEELEAVTDLARALGVPFDLSNGVTQAYERALERYGPVDGELLAVALLEERAGIYLRRRERP